MSARFPTAQGETVTAFALGPLRERAFAGVAAPMEDRVDYHFVNGFTDVGELPCRRAVRDEIKRRDVVLEPFSPVALNLPGFSRRLDFSGFWHRPTRLARWARTRLIPPGPGPHPFRLATCGGVHLWLDGRKVAAFEPYSRNEVQETELDLNLAPEGSELTLLIEDMAERDTQYFVELTWLGAGVLETELETDAAPEALATLMDLARAVRPARLVFDAKDELELVFDTPAPVALQVEGAVAQSVHLSHLPPLFTAAAILKAGEARVSLGSLANVIDGYHPLLLTLSIGAARVERRIAFARLGQPAPAALPGELAQRKAAALAHAAADGEPRMGRLLAMLETGAAWDETADAILDDTLAGIEGRRDCSDFVMVPLLWAFAAHEAAFPAARRDAVPAAILGFRYWMTEPGNDAMWFWSENHVLCFHVSEFIAGQLFPAESFPGSGLTGAEHRALAEARLGRWFDAVEAHGLAEWNSAAYYPVDFIGLFALEHWGEGALKARAAAQLDALFTMIALHTGGGVPAGSQGRAYDKELRAGPLTELAPFAAVAFGTGWLGPGVAALPEFCASGYAPPADLAALAQPAKGALVTAAYQQGYGPAARLKLAKTHSMQLSAAVDALPGAHGHQQHLVDIQAAANPFARIWVNHPGEDDAWGEARPSYWAGNGTMPRVGMDGPTCLVLYDLGPAPRIGFTHAYVPLSAFDEVARGADWLALRAGGGFAIVKATGPLEPVQDGPGAGLEFRLAGTRAGWALAVGDIGPGGLAAVAAQAETMQLSLAEGPLALSVENPGAPRLTLDYSSGLSIGGTPCPFPTASVRPEISHSRYTASPTKEKQ